ncbi:MAG: PRC-barrel domain-containing protein [Gillisia sp.]
MSNKNRNLNYLKGLSDYKVASGYPDVRGWEVIDAEGKNIGKIEGLLSNTKTERVVYLDLEVDEKLIEEERKTYSESAGEGPHEILNKEGETHLIIPIGMVRIDEDNNRVVSDGIDYGTLSTAKRFRGGEDIESSYEMNLYGHYTGDKSVENQEITDDFYDRPEFNTVTRRTDKK